MKKIFLLSLFIFSVLHSQIRAETVYDLLISGEREKGIAILRDLAENESNKDAMYVLGLLYNDASSINLCSIEDFCLGQNFSNYKEAKKIFVSKQSRITRVIGSRSHSNQFFDTWVNQNFTNNEIVQAGSSLKFCLVAEGAADIYPRFGPTSEWDIAAGHIIVNEAGGRVNTFENTEINYNQKEDLLNPQFYAIGNYQL